MTQLPGPVVLSHVSVNTIYRRYKRVGADREDKIKAICEDVKRELEDYVKERKAYEKEKEKRRRKLKKRAHKKNSKANRRRRNKDKKESANSSSSDSSSESD